MTEWLTDDDHDNDNDNGNGNDNGATTEMNTQKSSYKYTIYEMNSV